MRKGICRLKLEMLFLSVSVIFGLAGACFGDVHEMLPMEPGKIEKLKLTRLGEEAFDIRVLSIQEKQVSPEVVVPGRVEVPPNRSFRIHTLQEGRICRIFVRLGQKVDEGEVLAWLDSAEINRLAAEALQSKAQIEAELAQTRTILDDEVTQAESRFVLTKASFERSQQLYDEKIASRKEFEQARSEFEVATTRLAAAKKKREQVMVALTQKLDLTIEPLKQRLLLLGLSQTAINGILKTRRTVVCVPIRSSHRGVVVGINTTLGQSVSPTDELFTVADLSRMWIKGQVFESDVARIAEGQQVWVRVPSLPGTLVQGTLSYISAEVDPGARTLPVAAEVENKELQLKSGMYADVHIKARNSKACPVVPFDAVLQRDGKKYVLVQRMGAFEPVEVQLGHGFENYIEIVAGVKDGDRVVVEGAFQLEGALLASGAKSLSIGGETKIGTEVPTTIDEGNKWILKWWGLAVVAVFGLGLLTGLLILKVARHGNQQRREALRDGSEVHDENFKNRELEQLGSVDRW